MAGHHYQPWRNDWLYHVWEEDNHRDVRQHRALLYWQGRNVEPVVAYRDYARQQARQRRSKARASDAFHRPAKAIKEPLRNGAPHSFPDSRESEQAIAKATADDVLSRISQTHAKVLYLVFGMQLTVSEAAYSLNLSVKRTRTLLKAALEAASVAVS